MSFEDYLRAAYKVALDSPDLSTQNGAIIVSPEDRIIASGCNRLPDRVRITAGRLARPAKYTYTEHAERLCIYDAASRGMRTGGATMVCPWFACADCGRAIIEAGIVEVIGHQQMFDATPDRWAESIAAAWEMFGEAGVKTTLWSGKLGGCEPIRFNEKYWSP